MKQTEILKEAHRLYRLGFAVHWLHPKSKRPVESGWTTGPRKQWDYLKETYFDGLNLGARMGEASKIGDNYLACIDVDVKKPEARAAAMKCVHDLIGGENYKTCPRVLSGSGNGSRHFYCVTKEPFKMLTIAKSDDFEVCVYSTGRQMVLPPSIHPDTGKLYTWSHHAKSVSDFPLIEFKMPEVEKEKKNAATKKRDAQPVDSAGFEVENVDLDWLPISDKVRAAIKTGAGVADRSGYLLVASTALVSAGLSKNEILSVLTDPETYLGKCAYEHAKTPSRVKAAAWVWKYTLKKVMRERSAVEAFKEAPPVVQVETLNEEDADAQAWELRDWRDRLERTGPKGTGPYKASIENLVLILTNAIAPNLFQRNTFSFRDTYGAQAPWGPKPGDVLADDDVPKIKLWLGQNFGFEPGKETIYDAMTVIACDNAFDPVRDWLEALPAWDQTKRLDGWLKKNFAATGNDEYLAQVFRKWMVAMVLRVYEPGAKFDWMPIFEGAQGVGKSSFGRLLVGDQFFLDWLPNLADKDSALALQGMWGVEMGELSQFRKNELEVIKGFITRTVDKIRPPFGKRWVESSRRCVFFGTTNRDKYLRDDTGNRRFKPLQVGELNFKALHAEREQLFAEAKWLYDNFIETASTLELTGEAKAFELTIHADKMTEDDSTIMLEQIREFVDLASKNQLAVGGFDLTKFKIHSLFSGIGPLPKWRLDNRNMQFAAKALKSLGGEKWKSDGQIFWKLDKRDRVERLPVPLDFF